MPAQVVTVMNMKGGVGKTTVTANLAPMFTWWACWAAKKVLLIDYDAQFNLSQAWLEADRLRKAWDDSKTSLAILQDAPQTMDPFEIRDPGEVPPPSVGTLSERVYSNSAGGYVDLVPSTLDLMYIALGKSPPKIDHIERRFRVFVDEARNTYDVIFIDCHPAGSLLTRTALLNSDHVLIPVKPEPYAQRGAALMRDFLRKTRPDHDVPFHILFNGLTPREGNTEVERAIRAEPRLAARCLRTSLHRWKALADLSQGKSWVLDSGRPHSNRAWSNLFAVSQEAAACFGLRSLP